MLPFYKRGHDRGETKSPEFSVEASSNFKFSIKGRASKSVVVWGLEHRYSSHLP
jgi:hypothetical protein